MFSCALHLSMRLSVQELLIKTTKSYCKYVFVCTSQNYEKSRLHILLGVIFQCVQQTMNVRPVEGDRIETE